MRKLKVVSLAAGAGLVLSPWILGFVPVVCRLENLGERVPGRRSGGRGALGASERAPPFNAGHSVNGLVNEAQVR
jgi:hypothetical protein